VLLLIPVNDMPISIWPDEPFAGTYCIAGQKGLVEIFKSPGLPLFSVWSVRTSADCVLSNPNAASVLFFGPTLLSERKSRP